MATLTKGKTFGATETVTNTKLHQLIDNGSVSGIVSADINGATDSLIQISVSPPSAPVAGTAWYDSGNNLLREYDGAEFQPVARGYTYTNRSGVTLSIGNVVILDVTNDNGVATTTTISEPLVFGVVLVGGVNGAEIVIQTEGHCRAVTVTGLTIAGDFLFTSTVAGEAVSNASFGLGAFAQATTTGSVTVEAILGNMARNTAGAKFSSAAVIVNQTRTHATASGTQVIAHGAPGIPSEMRFYFTSFDGTQAHTSSGTCVVIAGAFIQGCATAAESSAPAHDDKVMAMKRAGDEYVAEVTAVDEDDVTITWTRINTPGGQTDWTMVSTI